MTIQPLVALGRNIEAQRVTHAALLDYLAGPVYRELLVYFDTYPPRSLMSSQSRCILYALIRMMQPEAVAEVGTLFAGTTEVMARALWENGSGVVYSADPFGGDRCPAILATWPAELRRHAEYHDLNSMDFFGAIDRRRIALDLVLVDGNHDFEFAMFDLHMAARLLRPGGIIVMDNSEQSGPFKASRAFLAANPAWRELGASVATYDPTKPFDRTRASLPGTSFVVLQAPDHLSITAGPHSHGQKRIDSQRVNGLLFDVRGSAKGTLFYQVFLRGFADGNRWVKELRTEGSIAIERMGRAEHRFGQPLIIDAPPAGSIFTVEVDLSWLGAEPLALADVPTPLW
jgi:predicted O-methyltransferase YrrM